MVFNCSQNKRDLTMNKFEECLRNFSQLGAFFSFDVFIEVHVLVLDGVKVSNNKQQKF